MPDSFRTSDWHLMHYQDDSYELYDVRNDPLEFENLAEKPEHKKVLKELDSKLLKRLEASEIKL